MSIGIPIKVLHEAVGLIVTCEMVTGDKYRDKLIAAQNNMSLQMTQITATYRDGKVAQLENVYIRGSSLKFLILPNMLKNAPMFKKQTNTDTPGRGKSGTLRAQVARGRGRGFPAQRGKGDGSGQRDPGSAGESRRPY